MSDDSGTYQESVQEFLWEEGQTSWDYLELDDRARRFKFGPHIFWTNVFSMLTRGTLILDAHGILRQSNPTSTE